FPQPRAHPDGRRSGQGDGRSQARPRETTSSEVSRVNLLDALPIVLILAYAALGFFTGLVRRFIGLIGLYLAFVGATNMGIQAGGILQQSSSFEVPDSRIFGFFGIVVVVIIIVEGATQLASSQIQVGALVFNRVLGVIIGVLTAVILSTLITYELIA